MNSKSSVAGRGLRALVIVPVVALAMLAGAERAGAIDVPVNCLVDADGANDLVGPKDVTRYCIDEGDLAPFELETLANFDETKLTGNNTNDVCSLYDTDSDGFVNLAVCTTLIANGAANGNLMVLDELRLYTCTDAKVDRCTGPTLVAGPYDSICEVSQQTTDPFPGPAPGPGDEYPDDTQVLCGVDLDDFGAAGVGAVPVDTCSYSSDNPNSNPSDCLNFDACNVDADCNDGSPCTLDSCHATGVCTSVPNVGAPCDDGLFCNGDDACGEFGICESGVVPRDCGDGVDCTIDTCDELTETCLHDPRNSLCSDDLFCTGVETCDALDGCLPGTPVDCGDGVSCTTDTCNDDTDTCDHAPSDAACDDGEYCNGDETCDAVNGCQAGTPVDCGDGVDCTVDACDEDTDACTNMPSNAACDDGVYCDGAETCDATLGCLPSSPIACADAVDCTVDACDEATDSCTFTPNHAACDDGEFCDGAEVCNASTGCEEGLPPACGDGIACTVDSCDEVDDECVHVPDDGLCGNADFCDGVDQCIPGLGCAVSNVPDCDDGVECTLDSCNEDSDDCDHLPNDQTCSDGVYCNGQETCDATLGCLAASPIACGDAVDCTVDACDEDIDDCTFTPNDSACDNGLFCDGAEVCDDTAGCLAGNAPSCNDGVDCTEDSCDPGADACVNAVEDDNCSDGLFCTGDETCDPVLDCVQGSAPDCDDGVDCTVDSCSSQTDGCENLPSDAFCDDGLYCTGDETCDAVNDCQPGTPVDCDDGIDCTQQDSCNEATDACDNIPNDDECADPDFCNGAEVCTPGVGCEPGVSPCPLITCDEEFDLCTGCTDDAECDNSVYCDGAEVCNAGTCEAGTPVDCSDGVDCTVDACDEQAGQCTNTANDALCDDGDYCSGEETCDAVLGCVVPLVVDCDDQVDCTQDSCNESTDSCENIPDDDACDNGDFCDGGGQCIPGVGCAVTPVPDCDDGVGCTTDSCNEDTDECDHLPDDLKCDNGEFCDGAETCDELAGCVEGTPPDCDDQVACTVDACEKVANACTNVPNNAACDDGIACNGTETCSAQNGCEAGTPEDCEDGVGCTTDTCNLTTGLCDHEPADVNCDNDTFCDGQETCDPVNDCQDGPVPDCNDGVACTVDSCDNQTAACLHDPDNASCGNGDFCDGDEVCDPMAGCVAADAPACDDGVDCTIDGCDEAADSCTNVASDALCDNEDVCDGTESCDDTLGCLAGMNLDCDDGIACTVDTCDEVTGCAHAADNAACNDGQFCNGVETCNVNSGCVAGTPVACPDAFQCTTDACNEQTDQCTHDFATCVCGDTEVTGVEECDPPAMAGTFEDCDNTIDDDGDGKIDCRDKDCKPTVVRNPPICGEDCQEDLVCAQFQRDPAIIYYSEDERWDEFYVHGRVPLFGDFEKVKQGAMLEISNDDGAFYRGFLFEGDFRGRAGGRRVRFEDEFAEYLGPESMRGGIAKFWLRRRRFEGVTYLVFTVRIYGDFREAKHRWMTTELAAGSEVGFLTAEWKANPRGWVLHQRDFLRQQQQ